jgi:cytochrome c oxidase subunit 2
MNGIPFVPEQASTMAKQVDALFLFELGIAGFFIFLIFVLIVYFAIRYHRRSDDEIPPRVGTHYALEVIWTVVPFCLMMVMYFWGASIYAQMKRPAGNALEIHVIGKQWMWKIEHEGGVREIDELHVPIGTPVKLILASQDVIHDFFIPEFRIKQDVVPGSYVTEWFEATRPGEYHLFCAQFCGTDHAKMVGKVIAMQPADYQAWLAGAAASEPPAEAGKKLFNTYGCISCHGQRAPTMAGLYDSDVMLEEGQIVRADENYLRESILNSTAKIVAGYPPVMPSYRGQLSEEQLFQLIAYIKSLQSVRNVPPGAPQRAAPLVAPSTRPAVGDQPLSAPNFPPAERRYQVPLPRLPESQ